MKNTVLDELILRAKNDESVFIDDVSEAFADEKCTIAVILSLALGGMKRFDIRIPIIDLNNEEQVRFVKEYIYARLYNAVSVYGGEKCCVCIGDNCMQAYELVKDLESVFDVGLPKNERKGYGKCLNVTDRVNSAVGGAPFSFEICSVVPELKEAVEKESDAVGRFRRAVDGVDRGCYCGIDIGGTDIKVAASRGGHIAAVKEYDWNPADYLTAEEIIFPIIVLLRAVRCALSCCDSDDERVKDLIRILMEKDTSVDEMLGIINELEHAFPQVKFNGVGVSFPDVVINNEIVGGETPKTKRMRETSEDYEREFGKLRGLDSAVREYCEDDASVRIANDGSIAAYSAAAELAFSDEKSCRVTEGVFAHSLGTELGTGLIDMSGDIPQIPLEVYNWIIDLGSYRSREYRARDIRSVLSTNNGLAGALQKYTSQTGAFRIAVRLLESNSPDEYEKIFTLGFLERSDGEIRVRMQPQDMRKPFLEYLMQKASAGQPEFEEVFRTIGEYLAVVWKETDVLLEPAVKSRVLFGRFIKDNRCFNLLCEGACRKHRIELYAADEELANTPLMLDLAADPVHSVAQFGQAVGAIYYSAS